MGTRSVVAEPQGDGWHGRYVHWDGYPSGVGRTVFALAESMGPETAREFLLREHTGWSSLAGADFSIAPGFGNSMDLPCRICGQGYVAHLEWPEGKGPGQGVGSTGYNALGHTYDRDEDCDAARRAQCYCHGERHEEDPGYITYDGDDWGTEWAYVIGPKGLTICERRFGKPGQDNGHGVGMFGLGASDTEAGGYWAHVTYLPYDRAVTDETWDMLDNGIYVPTEVTS